MRNLMDLDILTSAQNGFSSFISRPGIDIYLFLASFSLALAILSSLLIQQMAQRRFKPGSYYAWVAYEFLPHMLTPFLAIIFLLMADSVATTLTFYKSTLIADIIKLAFVWLLARLLLLLSHRHFMAYLVSGVMLALAILSVTDLLIPTQTALDRFAFETTTFRLSLLGVIKGIFMSIVLFWGAGVLSSTGERYVRRLHWPFNKRELAVKFLYIVLYILAFIFTLHSLGVDLTTLTVFGGALAVGIGFGLQKISSNLISGIVLLFEQTLKAGDLIQIGGEKGWVRRMAIRHTLIETNDGRELLIPNEDFITNKVTNWTYTNTRARIDMTITVKYQSDVELVKKLLLDTAKSFSLCLTDPAPACYLREFTERGFQFILVFWIPDAKEGMNSGRSEVMMRIVRAFHEHNIDFGEGIHPHAPL